jgi:hypothetical protein
VKVDDGVSAFLAARNNAHPSSCMIATMMPSTIRVPGERVRVFWRRGWPG